MKKITLLIAVAVAMTAAFAPVSIAGNGGGGCPGGICDKPPQK